MADLTWLAWLPAPGVLPPWFNCRMGEDPAPATACVMEQRRSSRKVKELQCGVKHAACQQPSHLVGLVAGTGAAALVELEHSSGPGARRGLRGADRLHCRAATRCQACGSAEARLTWLAWLPVALPPWLSCKMAPDPAPAAACVPGSCTVTGARGRRVPGAWRRQAHLVGLVAAGAPALAVLDNDGPRGGCLGGGRGDDRRRGDLRGATRVASWTALELLLASVAGEPTVHSR